MFSTSSGTYSVLEIARHLAYKIWNYTAAPDTLSSTYQEERVPEDHNTA